MKVEACQSYAARHAGTGTWRSGPSHFKIYYVDIYGRPHPERFEWPLHERGPATIPPLLDQVGVEGIGFVIAFPHIVKVFRWSPRAETLLLVRAVKPSDGSAIDLDRGEGDTEFACLAEAVIAAAEYQFWAAAPSVEAYLAQWCEWDDLPIVDHGKLRRYWVGPGTAEGQ